MEPEGITLFSENGVVSSQPTFAKLRVQSQEIRHHNSLCFGKEAVEGFISSEPHTCPRAKFQKPRPLPYPVEEPLDLDQDHLAKHSPEPARVDRKAKFDKHRPLPSRGDSLIDFPSEDSDVENIDQCKLRRHASVSHCSRNDCHDGIERPTFANRRSKSIRLPNSSEGEFQPRRAKSMRSSCATSDLQEDEIWVETFSMNEEGRMEYYFKGLKGQESFKEPPTGAMNVVYLEDVVVGERDDPAVLSDIKREMEVPSVVKKGKKKSRWASFVQRYKSSRTLLASN